MPRPPISQVVEDAVRDGPQTVTRRGVPVVVVVSVETWERMSGSGPSLKAYLRDGALDGLDLHRDGPSSSIRGSR
ncbi:MAG: type II toxin-antitoxin system prevent-host-death family antitoxin [Myxococcales bacterium]|nr:type II toxin-antitoxin system prevent-host-death family antitoxin [Myxococcales bacterium]